MKQIIFLFFLLFIISFGENVCVGGQNRVNKNPVKLLSINEINEKNLKGKVVHTEGYVVKIFSCPPCPAGTYCKPCMENNAVVSMEDNLLESYSDLTEKDIIVFGIETGKLKTGKKYQFKLKIADRKSTGQTSNDIELLSYKPIE